LPLKRGRGEEGQNLKERKRKEKAPIFYLFLRSLRMKSHKSKTILRQEKKRDKYGCAK